MSTKPILFNTEMVKAILDGRKTQTRRIVKGAEKYENIIDLSDDATMITVGKDGEEHPKDVDGLWATFEWDGCPEFPMVKSKYAVGDVLWVRETFSQLRNPGTESTRFVYRATDDYPFGEKYIVKFRWRPLIHMPREAARIFLCVTGVRVERLLDISQSDALSEGIGGLQTRYQCAGFEQRAKFTFGKLWDATARKLDLPKYGWNANPWVWVYEFARCEKPEGWK